MATNEVRLSGTVVGRYDFERPKGHRRGWTPRIALEIYNPNVQQVLRCAVYGHEATGQVPRGLGPGSNVEIVGRVSNIFWRTPGVGRIVRQLGIEVQQIGSNGRDPVDLRRAARRRRHRRPSDAQLEELERLAGRLRLSDLALSQSYLDGRPAQDVPRSEMYEVLRRMAQDAREATRVPVGTQLDAMMLLEAGSGKEQEEAPFEPAIDEELAEYVGRLIEARVKDLEDAVESLPDDDDLRRAVIETALEQESRPTAKLALTSALTGISDEGESEEE